MENPFRFLADSPTPVYEFNPVKVSPCNKVNTAYIFQSVKHGDVTAVEKVLINGMSANTIYRGNTILNHAIYYNQNKIIKLLINYGADPSLKSPKYDMDAYKEAESKKEILDILGATKIN